VFKLNNKGWGMTMMIIFLCIFILAIIVSAILAYRFGLGKNPF